MKKSLLFSLFCLLNMALFAQAPQGIAYQGVAADNSGAELSNQDVSLRFSILQGSPNGNVLWEETHQTATDDFGLFTTDLGMGQRSGGSIPSFDEMPWGDGPFFLQVEMDPTGGLDFEFVGTNPILSVPYAIYAREAGRAAFTDSSAVSGFATNAINAINADSSNFANNASNAVTADTSIFATVALTAVNASMDNDTSATNELQHLTFNNGELSISGGNSLVLNFDDADADPQNEIQNLILNGTELSLTGGGNSVNLASQSFGGPGASSDFPQGIVGEYRVLTDQQFTVPPGKTMFITAAGPSITIKGVGVSGGAIHNNAPNMPILPSGTIISDCNCTALLVDETPFVDPVVVSLNAPTPTYTVPPGKIFFLKSGLTNSNTAYLNVNGQEMEFLRPNFTRSTRIMAFPEGSLIRKSVTQSGEVFLTGYLIDTP